MNMSMESISVAVDKRRSALSLTLKCATVQSLITFADNIKLNKITANMTQRSTPSYIPYILSSGIMECVRSIVPDLTQRKISQYTKSLSLGIGIITSAVISSGFDGVNFFVSFSINLLKTTASTLIIDKLNKLKTIDGMSLAIVLSCLFSIPSIIEGVATGGLVMTLLFLLSISVVFLGNYKFLKSTEDLDMHYKDKTDKFSLSCRGSSTISLVISSTIISLVSSANSFIAGGLMLIINPLIQWATSKHTIDIDELNKNIQQNGIYIDGMNHGKDTTNTVNCQLP